MRLYAGSTEQFIRDAVLNQVAEKLKQTFLEHYGFNPSGSEINSWRNSLRAISQVFQYAALPESGLMLEYQLPLTSRRLDCIVCGKDSRSSANAVIIELKQWDKCSASDSANEVRTFVGGNIREVLHPSVQVNQYRRYLMDTHTAFYEGDAVDLHACAYLHNYSFNGDDELLNEKFRAVLTEAPVFSGDHVPELSEFLQYRLNGGGGLEVLRKVEESKYRPSKKLMDHVGNVIRGVPQFILLDEQLVVYDKVFELAKKSYHNRKKSAIIIKGGPGTGKSVIAINLMADLLLQGFNAQYATGSKAFTETLRSIIGSRGSTQFKYFNSYMAAQPQDVDVLICDEAHRIRSSSKNRFTRQDRKSDKKQIDELVHASRVSVFFIDDFQVIRPGEIGSVDYIRENTESMDCEVHEFELEAQFRCNGSDAFVNWINNTLGIRRTANKTWEADTKAFDFRIMNSPEELEEAIMKKAREGASARLVAGFCWPWSDPDRDGNLVEDVVLGDFRRPWNAKPEASRLAKGIPKASLWASDPGGLNQVGCVYTAQGFEFDYVGVIFGLDLRYDLDRKEWIGDPLVSQDSVVKRSRTQFTDFVKNTYRVLLSRGLKGCYVYFQDKDTKRFFDSRID